MTRTVTDPEDQTKLLKYITDGGWGESDLARDVARGYASKDPSDVEKTTAIKNKIVTLFLDNMKALAGDRADTWIDLCGVC